MNTIEMAFCWFESSPGHFLVSWESAYCFWPSWFVALYVAPIVAAISFSKPMKNNKFPYSNPVLVDYSGDTSKRWYIKFYIWDIALGKKVRVRWANGLNDSKNKSARYQVAAQALALIRAELKSGKVKNSQDKVERVSTKNLSMAEAILFVLDKKQALSLHWKRSYKRVAKLLSLCWPKKMPAIQTITLSDCHQFIDWMDVHLNCSPKTINEYCGIISSVLNYFINMEVISKNPMAKIPKRKTLMGEANIPFTLQEVRAIFAQAEKEGLIQWILFCKFILYTLARTGKELAKLRVRDIRTTSIYIPKERAKTGGRSIDIAPALELLIQQFELRKYPADFYVFGADGLPGPLPRGRDYFYNNLIRILKILKMNDRGHTLYAFKHTGAIQAVIAGVDMLAIQNMCGHHDLKTTQKYLINIGAIRQTGNELAKLPNY